MAEPGISSKPSPLEAVIIDAADDDVFGAQRFVAGEDKVHDGGLLTHEPVHVVQAGAGPEEAIDAASDDVVDAEGASNDSRDEARGRSALAQPAQTSAPGSAQATAQTTATTTADVDQSTTVSDTSPPQSAHEDAAPVADDSPANPYIVHDDTPEPTPDGAGDDLADGPDSASE